MKILSLLAIPFFLSSLHSPGNSVRSTPTPTTQVCSQSSGTITDLQIGSTVLEKPLFFRVYTPPCYSSDEADGYPVLYLFHGSSFTEDQWDRLGIDETADQLISSGEIEPLIIVLPRETSYNDDPRTSKFGQAVLTDLIPYIEGNYAARSDRGGRAIGGLSRGAGWAIHLGLANPDLFGSVGAHSLALFAGDINLVSGWRKRTAEELLPRLYLDDGLQDYLKDSAKKFELRLSEYSYPHEWHLNLGSHNEKYWQSHVEEYLLWYSLGWTDLSQTGE